MGWFWLISSPLLLVGIQNISGLIETKQSLRTYYSPNSISTWSLLLAFALCRSSLAMCNRTRGGLKLMTEIVGLSEVEEEDKQWWDTEFNLSRKSRVCVWCQRSDDPQCEAVWSGLNLWGMGCSLGSHWATCTHVHTRTHVHTHTHTHTLKHLLVKWCWKLQMRLELD